MRKVKDQVKYGTTINLGQKKQIQVFDPGQTFSQKVNLNVNTF